MRPRAHPDGADPTPRGAACPRLRNRNPYRCSPGGSIARRLRDQHAFVIERSRPRIASYAPLIGVVTHELRAEAEPAWAARPGREARDLSPQRLALRLTYTQAIQEAGGIAVVLPTHGYVDDVEALLDRLDGVVFSGGPDIDPATYGQAPHPRLGPDVDLVSDQYELALHAAVARRDLPMLGICRGMQALNVSRGGTLIQHLPDRTDTDHNQRQRAFEPIHDVSVAPGSLLRRLTGHDRLEVNSFHHQAVDVVGSGLRVGATAADGTVESVWDPAARFCLGVQWHPEVLTHLREHAGLFDQLVLAARGRPALALVA
jgi:putative glutamine amidotransferase